MDYYQSHGHNARLTCRHFDVSPQTFYRWRRRYDAGNLRTLEDRSRRPRRLRQPTWSPELAQAVLRLREHYPRWGKDKLVVLLRQEGWQCSTSMVGRILRQMKESGELVEAPLKDPWQRPRPFRRPYGIRKPKQYVARAPGDLVEVDTADIRPLPGWAFKHFTACDVVTRWQVVEAHSRATAQTAAGFLDTILRRTPFPIKAIQVDGGSEFMAQFETACQERGIQVFVLPPRSPKLNGHVERAQRTHREEFYQVVDLPDSLKELNEMLRAWEQVHNCCRPHQALEYKTPQRFLEELALGRPP
jgi:transposase InsO family protein